MKILKLGIDDAGRGPVIGPMILAGCLVNDDIENEFKELGVTDSKKLTQKKREFLSDKIKAGAIAWNTQITYPEDIDQGKKDGVNLNDLEAIKCANIINALNDGKTKIKVIVDCPSTNLITWADYLKSKIKNLSNLEISCEHKADKNHVSVSAASILAKCLREIEMDKLRKKYGECIGSGYTSDSKSRKFLENNILKFDKDGIFRKSWTTWQKIWDKSAQKTLC